MTNARLLRGLVAVAFLVGLCLTSLQGYLLFHSLAEMFASTVAFGIFMLVWNGRRYLAGSVLPFLGIAYLFVGLLGFLHALAYSGMGVFPDRGTNLATQLWIAARSVEAVSFVVWSWTWDRRPRPGWVFAVFLAVTAVLLLAIFTWRVFPVCFVEGEGLTAFKKGCEYVIMGLLATAIFFIHRRRRELDATVFRLLVGSLVLTMASELAFTLYLRADAFANLVGHVLMLVSVFLVYKALIEVALRKPYDLLFRELKQSEEELARSLAEKEVLLREVHHRVKNNLQVVTSLLRLRARGLGDEKALRALDESRGRVAAMSLVHETIYRSRDLGRIRMQDYLERLIAAIVRIYEGKEPRFRFRIDGGGVVLGIDDAAPIGLVVHELVSNALQHAFPDGKGGEIDVRTSERDGFVELVVADDGVGLPADGDPREARSFGLSIVVGLVEGQLRGRLDWTSGAEGTRFTAQCQLKDGGCEP